MSIDTSWVLQNLCKMTGVGWREGNHAIKLTQVRKCNLCLSTNEGHSNKLMTGGEYYLELQLKMVI